MKKKNEYNGTSIKLLLLEFGSEIIKKIAYSILLIWNMRSGLITKLFFNSIKMFIFPI